MQIESNTSLPAPTRIAVYDDMLSAPRIIDIEPAEISLYIEEIASKTYEFAQQKGSSIPYTVIKEVCENFIHADFKEPCISILENGNTITFTDQGPGIEDKERAQLPGFTSATTEMRKYIRGVGSGLPTYQIHSGTNHLIVVELLDFLGHNGIQYIMKALLRCRCINCIHSILYLCRICYGGGIYQ